MCIIYLSRFVFVLYGLWLFTKTGPRVTFISEVYALSVVKLVSGSCLNSQSYILVVNWPDMCMYSQSSV